jgi:hypothetical protein
MARVGQLRNSVPNLARNVQCLPASLSEAMAGGAPIRNPASVRPLLCGRTCSGLSGCLVALGSSHHRPAAGRETRQALSPEWAVSHSRPVSPLSNTFEGRAVL